MKFKGKNGRIENMAGNGSVFIDSLEDLEKSGFDNKQAKAIIKSIAQNSASKTNLEFATEDLKKEIKNLDLKIENVRAELKKDIEKFRTDLVVKIEETKSDLFYKILLLFIANIGILGGIMTLIKFLTP